MGKIICSYQQGRPEVGSQLFWLSSTSVLAKHCVKMYSYPLLCVLAWCIALVQTSAFIGPRTFRVNGRYPLAPPCARNTNSRMFMTAEVDAPPTPTAESISKDIAHPEAVATVADDILKVLPHRYPFALVDKVLHFEPGKRIVGVKCISHNEPQFTGHFPDNPIMPGVLQVCDAPPQHCSPRSIAVSPCFS